MKKRRKIPSGIKSYTVIFNKLLEWRFPAWPSDPIGCANLLLEQARAMKVYIMPLFKVIQGISDPVKSSVLREEMKFNGVIPKISKTYEDWIRNCPCIKEHESQIHFSIDNEVTPITFHFIRMNYGMLKITVSPRWSKSTKRRPNNSYILTNLYNFISILSQKAKIKEENQIAIIKLQPTRPLEQNKARLTYEKNPELIYKTLTHNLGFEDEGNQVIYDEPLRIERSP